MTSPQPDREFADVILAQLGGNRFLAMTGAKQLVISTKDRYLKMSLSKRLTKDYIEYVLIRLRPNDTYTIEGWKVRPVSLEPVLVSKRDDVYADNLRQSFEAMTGLRTSL